MVENKYSLREEVDMKSMSKAYHYVSGLKNYGIMIHTHEIAHTTTAHMSELCAT